MEFEFYKAAEINEGSYIKIPKQFYTCPYYKQMLDSTARELYGFLKDRMNLSKKEENVKNFTDKNGYIYLIFTREQVMKTFGISKSTCSNAFKVLNETKLIYEKRQGQGSVNLIYIGKIKYMTESEALQLLETIGKSSVKQKSKKQTSKNRTSKSSKIKPLEVQNLDSNNTDVINPYINKTNYVVVVEAYTKAKDKSPTKAEKEKLIELSNNYSEELILKAIDMTVEQAEHFNIKYIRSILKSFKTKGLNTLQEVESHLRNDSRELQESIEHNRNKKKKTKGNSSSKSSSNNSFTDRKQATYNISEIERGLLGWNNIEEESEEDLDLKVKLDEMRKDTVNV